MDNFFTALGVYVFVGVCFGLACVLSRGECPHRGVLFMLTLFWPLWLLVIVFYNIIDD